MRVWFSPATNIVAAVKKDSMCWLFCASAMHSRYAGRNALSLVSWERIFGWSWCGYTFFISKITLFDRCYRAGVPLDCILESPLWCTTARRAVRFSFSAALFRYMTLCRPRHFAVLDTLPPRHFAAKHFAVPPLCRPTRRLHFYHFIL
jgi:hypothetical protein